MSKQKAVYATIYDPTPGENPVAHCCIHFPDRNNFINHTISGAMYVNELLENYDCPIYDITHVYHIFDMNKDNILELGGILIRN